MVYIADPYTEVERRASASPAERFEPLFAEEWRRTYGDEATYR